MSSSKGLNWDLFRSKMELVEVGVGRDRREGASTGDIDVADMKNTQMCLIDPVCICLSSAAFTSLNPSHAYLYAVPLSSFFSLSLSRYLSLYTTWLQNEENQLFFSLIDVEIRVCLCVVCQMHFCHGCTVRAEDLVLWQQKQGYQHHVNNVLKVVGIFCL